MYFVHLFLTLLIYLLYLPIKKKGAAGDALFNERDAVELRVAPLLAKEGKRLGKWLLYAFLVHFKGEK